MMMKIRFAQAIVAFALLCSATPLYAATPWLHADGNVIKDPCGNTVVLRGVDLIDLGFLQDWEGGAIAMVDRLTNTSDPCGSSPGWYPRVLRIMIAPPDSVSGWPHPFDPNNTDLYTLLRTVVDYCKTKGLYAIIDWHYVDNTYSHVASTNQFWTYMAPKFANDSHVIFELFNEPINTGGSDNANWLSVRTDMQNWFNIVRSYAPNNLILVAGASWSQTIGPAATYPLTGDNIAIVSHIYPGHWLNGTPGSNWYTTNINNCLTRYPVFMSEWGFYNNPSDTLGYGSITNYGQPLQDFREARKISNSAWVSSYDWTPTMFTGNATNYILRVGEYEMGGFVKDTLYLTRSNDQPSDGDTIPPAAPTGLTATPSTGTITLDWSDNTEGDLYGYDIYRSTTPGGETNRLNLVRSKTSAYTDTNVMGTRTYYYVVTAVDTNFNSSTDSIEVSATVPADSTKPAAPSGVSATGGDTIVSLNWNDNSEIDINGYNVYRSYVPGGPYTKLNGAPLTSSDYNDTSVTNGTIYYYVVTAVDTSLNESANSSQVSARPQLNPIVGILGSWTTGTTHAKETGTNRALVFVAHTKGTTSSTPSLTAVTYGGRSMTKIIDRSTGSSTTRVYVAAFILNDANITAATSTTFTPTWTNQPPSITYSSVFIKNVNQTTLVGATASAGTTNGTTVSTSALANSNGDMVLESAASSVAGTYSVTAGWTKDVDLSVTGYDGMGGHKPATGASETPSITLSSSANHSLVGFVVKMAPNVAPAAPTGLTANSGIGIVLLNWNDNSEPDFNGYNVYRSTTSGSGYVKLNSSLLDSSDYTDTNVVKETTYYYVVTAVDTAGLESVNSGEVSATPSNPAEGTGAILREWWLGIAGVNTGDLTYDVNYPDNPGGGQLLAKLEGPVNWGDNYGSRISGYLNPVTTGDYTFWIASSDSSDLYMSMDPNNPDDLDWIAYVEGDTDPCEWDKYESQQSTPISLVAGQKYHIVVVHKASVGNDNIAVAWEGPGISRQVIDGIYLSPCGLKFPEFAGFADQWNRTDCGAGNDWCSGSDFNRDGTVGIDDLMAFADGWLAEI
jgi:fibronectin type 3 domain-containing protein